MMLEFISNNPMYLVALAVCILLVVKVFIEVLKEDTNENRNSDDNDGGIFANTDPDLDLPPGVTLPVDSKELVH